MMRKRLMVLVLAALVVLGLGTGRASAQPYGPSGGPMGGPMDSSYFYDSLAPYGEWINLSPWGNVFCPYNQGIGWTPYSDGDWVDSDWGWTFESDAPWAWAGYHYGRWAFDANCGWVWIPGTVWGPAWVAWRFGGGFCGWAPLPPQVGFGFGIGLQLGGFDLDDIPWSNWCFTDVNWLGRRGMRNHVFERTRNLEFFQQTRNITNYGFEGNRIIDRGIDPREVERLTHRTIPRYEIADKGMAGSHISRFNGNRLEMFRPNLKEGAAGIAPKNILPRHIQVPPENLQQRHLMENQNLNQHYDQSLNEMTLRHKKELNNPPKGMTTQDLKIQHDNELKQIQSQHQTEVRVLQNRHQREQTMNNNYHQSSNQGGGGGKKKH